VKKNMADNGAFHPPRYVGLGFQLDSNINDAMKVVRVTPDTPASEVLMEGDVFVSVAGIPATPENNGKMSFRGQPGETVKAVIIRGGKEMAIEVKRGVIAITQTKAQSLANIVLGNRENWPVDSFQIDEVLGEGNVVYVVSSYTDTEADTNIKYTERIISRFVFDDHGKVAWTGGLGESRFVLEQQGYTISR
jgi:C-terminal processing protease CtpA/Prc